MVRWLFLTAVVGTGVVAPPDATAHYNMLLPQNPAAKKGETVVFHYRWGHPFEHQLFPAPPPVSLAVVGPDGKKADLLTTIRPHEEAGPDGKPVTTYRFEFTPGQRGDFVFLLKTPPIWMEEEQEFFEDAVKVVFHVQAQKGWDATVGDDLEITPLTRPYGLRAGMVFQARAGTGTEKLAVEIERYNAVPPRELPPDEDITRVVKTDPNGVATCTLPEAGWWGLTAIRDGGKRERDGKQYPVRRRSTLWVFVGERAGSTESK